MKFSVIKTTTGEHGHTRRMKQSCFTTGGTVRWTIADDTGFVYADTLYLTKKKATAACEYLNSIDWDGMADLELVTGIWVKD